MKIDLIDPSEPVLNEVSVEVEGVQGDENQALIDEMLRIASGEQGDKERKTMVGLAAPQVGILKRVVLVGVDSIGDGSPPELRVYVNPKIVEHSQERALGREGCYSTGTICGAVMRYERVVIEALDRHGATIREEHVGFPARIFQHEIDHLDGVRFPDRIEDDAKLHHVDPAKFGAYRDEWQTWTELTPRSEWESMKGQTN